MRRLAGVVAAAALVAGCYRDPDPFPYGITSLAVLPADGIGHFTPLEAPHEFAAVVMAASRACANADPRANGRPGESHMGPDKP